MLIDPLSIARDLRAVELPADQAEAIAAAIARSVSDGAAAKSDFELLVGKIESLERGLIGKLEALERTTSAKIDALEQTTSAKFTALDAQLTSKIDNARSSLLIWLMGVIFATAGVIIAVFRYAAA